MIDCLLSVKHFITIRWTTFKMYLFCSVTGAVIVLTLLLSSSFSGGFWQTLPDLHSGLLHLSGITYGGHSHPRILSVRKPILVFTERIHESLHKWEIFKSNFKGLFLLLGIVQKTSLCDSCMILSWYFTLFSFLFYFSLWSIQFLHRSCLQHVSVAAYLRALTMSA